MSHKIQRSTPPSPKNIKRGWCRVPDIYVILFIFIAIAAIATHFVPAGQFERVPALQGA